LNIKSPIQQSCSEDRGGSRVIFTKEGENCSPERLNKTEKAENESCFTGKGQRRNEKGAWKRKKEVRVGLKRKFAEKKILEPANGGKSRQGRKSKTRYTLSSAGHHSPKREPQSWSTAGKEGKNVQVIT